MSRPSQGRPTPGPGGGKTPLPGPRPTSSRPTSSADVPVPPPRVPAQRRPPAPRSADQSSSNARPAASASSSSTTSRASKPAVGAASTRRPTSAEAGAATPPNKSSAPRTSAVALRVYTESKKDDIGLRTLLGDYRETGMNLGRKTYQKIQGRGREDYEVHLYYWDSRDGAEFSGWWFGSAVGGTEVWSRCESHSHTPPLDSWRVPWDGDVGNLLSIEIFVGGAPSPRGTASVPGAPGRPTAREANGRAAASASPRVSERAVLAGERVGDVEAETQRVLEDSRTKCTPPVSLATLEEVAHAIMNQQKSVGETQKGLQKDVEEAKAAQEDPAIMQSLSKMGTRLRALHTSLTSELGTVKGMRSDMAERQKRRAEEKEKQKKAEEEDAQALQQLLPEAMDQVTQVEDAVETVEILAAPLGGAEEGLGSAAAEEENAKLVDDVDKAASKAQNTISGAKRQIEEFIGKAKRFSQEARKTAAREFTTLKERIDALQLRLNPFKKFKQEYRDAHAARKGLEEIASMLGTAELEVEKARIMGSSAMDEQMTKDDIKAADELLGPARKGIDTARTQIDRKLKQTSSSFLRRELTKSQERADKARAMLEETAGKLDAQRDGLALQQLLEQGHKKVDKAEYAMHDTSEAEMPFLKGIEDLPPQEALEGVKACEEAASKATILVEQAKTFLKTQSQQRFSQSVKKKATDEMGSLAERLNEVQKKLAQFTKDTAQRKAQAVLGEVAEKITETESQVQMLGEITKLFVSRNVQEVSTDSLQATCDQSTAAEKEAVAIMNEAQKLLASKKKEFTVHQQREGPEGAVLAKLHKRLATANEELARHRKIAAYGTGLIKAKDHLEKAKSMTKQAEESLERLNTAEAPFIKGLEVLPHDEAYKLFSECEFAANHTHKVMTDARTFIAAKNAEVKTMPDEVGKPIVDEFTKMLAQVQDVRSKLEEFQRNTDSRRKTMLMEEAKSKVEKLAKEVQAATEAAKPLAEDDPDKISQAVASQVCEKLAVLDKATQKHMDECKNFLQARKLDVKGNADQTSVLNALTGQLGALQTELTKTKRAASEHEQRFVAKKLMSEYSAWVKDVEAEVERVKAHIVPLIQERGQKLLVAERVLNVIDAISEHMQKSGKTVEDMFKEISGKVEESKEGDGNDAKVSFCAYLDKLPTELGREDLTYSAAQREEMFAHVVSEHDGKFTLAGFKSLFVTRYSCVEKISVTDIFEISKSKSVTKLEVDQVVEAVGRPRLSEKLGVNRIEVKMENGTVGWVTMKGNHGTAFLEPFSPYASFVQSADRLFEVALKSAGKASAFVKHKASELASCAQGPLAQARAELEKLRPRVSSAQKALEDLKRKMSDAKRDFVKSQESEKRTQQEVRDRKVADVVLQAVRAKVELMDSGAKKVAEAAKSLISAEGATLEAFPKPLAVTSAVEELVAANAKDCEAVRDSVKEHKEALSKQPRTNKPLQDARSELGKASGKADSTEKQNAQSLEAARKACKAIADARILHFAAALRQELQSKEITVEALFAELAAGQERITEEAFCAHIAALGVDLPEEHGKLVVMHLDPEGISRRCFQKMVQQYYKCVKAITMTEEFQISKSKTVRHLELNEIVELLDGPKRLEKSGINRIKAKAFTDGAVGWISLKGNQGTPFLMETGKPFYSCSAEVRLEKSFGSGDGPDNLVRTLRQHEFLEVLAGPRLEEWTTYPLRSKVKACLDGASGYITVKTREGVTNAEKGVYMICTAGIAITDNRNIRTCKVIRKLQVGEVFSVLEGPFSEDSSKLTRAKIKATTDKMEGWVTTTGNAGTVYASESSRHYTVLQATDLQKGFRSQDAEKIRALAEGEAVEVTETPKEEKPEEVLRLQGRALNDGSVGWVTFRCGSSRYLAPSTLIFKCDYRTDIHSAPPLASGPVLRSLETGETVELLDGPVEEQPGILRIRARAESDGVVGFIKLKDEKGMYLTPIKPK